MPKRSPYDQKRVNLDAKTQIGLKELLEVREEITPLYVRDIDRILKIENIAKGVATPASKPDDSAYTPVPTTFWGQPIPDSSSAA